jgi:hypothetical protein
MSHNDIVRQLPAHLFWDSNISKLDDVEHYKKIIIRTFERGDLDQMATVMAYYGKEVCGEVLIESPYLMERAMIFGSLFLEIPKMAFCASGVNQHHAI